MDQLMTAAEVADLLRVHKEVVYDEVKVGRMKAVRIGKGRNLRFREKDVEAYLDACVAHTVTT